VGNEDGDGSEKTSKGSTMHVALTPELARFVRERVASGLYGSASELVRESLRMMLRQELRDAAGDLDRDRVRGAIAGLRRLRQQQRLGHDLTLRELIDEGRA